MNPEPIIRANTYVRIHVCMNQAVVQRSGDFKNITTASKENQLYELFDNIIKNQASTVSLPMVRSEKH